MRTRHHCRLLSLACFALCIGCGPSEVPVLLPPPPTTDTVDGAENAQANQDPASSRMNQMTVPEPPVVPSDAPAHTDVMEVEQDSPLPGDSPDASSGESQSTEAQTPTSVDPGVAAQDGDTEAPDVPMGGNNEEDAPPAEPLCGPPLGPGECIGVSPASIDAPSINPDVDMLIPGAPKPAWRLEDIQCLSCGLGQTYGLDTFNGTATLVALFNAGCGICQNQALRLEQMRFELESEGYAAHFVAVNSIRDIERQDGLINRCSFPILQDTEDVMAMEAMQGGIYDMYIYRPNGVLHVYLEGNSDLDTWLYPSGEDAEDPSPGYQNVKAALISAIQGQDFVPPHPAPEPTDEEASDP